MAFYLFMDLFIQEIVKLRTTITAITIM